MELTEQLRILGKRYDDEQEKSSKLQTNYKKVEAELARVTKSNFKYKAEMESLRDEKEELVDKCDVLQEEYDKILKVQ